RPGQRPQPYSPAVSRSKRSRRRTWSPAGSPRPRRPPGSPFWTERNPVTRSPSGYPRSPGRDRPGSPRVAGSPTDRDRPARRLNPPGTRDGPAHAGPGRDAAGNALAVPHAAPGRAVGRPGAGAGGAAGRGRGPAARRGAAGDRRPTPRRRGPRLQQPARGRLRQRRGDPGRPAGGQPAPRDRVPDRRDGAHGRRDDPPTARL